MNAVLEMSEAARTFSGPMATFRQGPNTCLMHMPCQEEPPHKT